METATNANVLELLAMCCEGHQSNFCDWATTHFDKN